MKINKIVIDSTDSETDLCRLGVMYPTDKSPYNTDPNLHKHAYTPVYDLIFSHLRHKNIVMGEIGIYNNESIKCWREYFSKATIYGFDNHDPFLEKALLDDLPEVYYHKMDVNVVSSIEKCLSGKMFDVLIDDSTHDIQDQERIIKSAYKYLSPGGIFVIEDIFLSTSEEVYNRILAPLKKYFSSITFIQTKHYLQQSPGWSNDKLLVLVRNDYSIEQGYKDLIDSSFEYALKDFSKIGDFVKNMEGMSGQKTRHLYNNLLDFPDVRYLEIGVWKGSSVCAAMCNNKAIVLCMDNWSEFGGPKEDFLNNLKECTGDNSVEYLEQDCFSVDISTIGKYNIYMYDGNHDEQSHYKSLEYYLDALDDTFIFVVDDWNWEYVRNGVERAIKDLGLEVITKTEVRLSQDGSTTTDSQWWNGVVVFLLKKSSF